MEPIESSETSAYINTLTPGTYPKEKKLQSKHGESLKSRVRSLCINMYESVRRISTLKLLHRFKVIQEKDSENNTRFSLYFLLAFEGE